MSRTGRQSEEGKHGDRDALGGNVSVWAQRLDVKTGRRARDEFCGHSWLIGIARLPGRRCSTQRIKEKVEENDLQ